MTYWIILTIVLNGGAFYSPTVYWDKQDCENARTWYPDNGYVTTRCIPYARDVIRKEDYQ